MIWQASYSPFGQATVNGDPDGDSVFYVQNIRLPGQYYDTETGLHYNYQRDYNPRSGRYLTGDPLGFGGGSLNLYAYCAGDPINWADPTGEEAATISASVLFIPYAVRAQAVAALNAIMPASRFDYRMAFVAFIVFFAILSYEHKTFQFARSVGVPAFGPISVPAILLAWFAGKAGGGEGGSAAGGGSGVSSPNTPGDPNGDKNDRNSPSRSQISRIKKLIRHLSQNDQPGLTPSQLEKLRRIVDKFGGKIRMDLKGIRGSGTRPYVHVDGLGPRIKSRHIWLR